MSVLNVTLSARARLSLATEHAGLPAIHTLTIQNTGESTIEHIALSIELDPACGTGWSDTLAALGPGQTKRYDTPQLVMSPDALRTLTETQNGVVRAKATAGDHATTNEAPITLLPATHWPGSDAPLGLLASFVRWSPSLQTLLRKAATEQERARGTRTFDGYQTQRRQRVVDQVQAIWVALSAEGLDYLSPPPSFETHGQKIVPPGEVLQHGSGACLDLSVLMATVLERVGLHPVLILVEGHAFVGVWLDGTPYSSAIHDSGVAVRKAVDSGELLVLETTLLASDAPLDAARAAARKHLDDDGAFLFLLDIQPARESFPPLPFDGALTSAHATPEQGSRPTTWADATVVEKEQLEAPQEPQSGLEARLKSWKIKLLDLSLRNRLLNLREGKTLVRLLSPNPAEVEDWLAAGKRVPIIARPELRGEVDAEAISRRAQSLHARQETLADHTERDLEARLKELARAGKTSIEESGAVTTYLGLGMLRWIDQKSPEKTRHAPILLVPVTIHRGRAGKPYQIEFSDMADTQVNVTLLTYLKQDYGLEHDGLGTDALPADESGVDVPRILQRFRELVRSKSEWEVENRAVLAPLTFKKFLMYKDLVASTDALLKNDIVSRILTGDGGGFGLERALLDEHELDTVLAPSDVLPVLPADPSQLAAVAACAHGSSFVLQGPPGTGKSQTITNLIADTLSRGQTVLFVAEKKAAIEVVHRRLQQVGLGPFTLELHSDKASKKQSIDQLRAAIDQFDVQEPRNWELVANELTMLRSELNQFANAMRAASVAGPPVYQVLSALIGLRDTPLVSVSFEHLDAAACRRHDALVEQAVGILERVGSPATGPWKWSRLQQPTPQLSTQLTRSLDGLEQALAGAKGCTQRLPEPWSLAGAAGERANTAQLARCLSTAGQLPVPMLQAVDLNETEAVLRSLESQTTARQSLWQPLAATWDPSLLTDHLRADLLARFERWAGVFLLGWLFLWGARKQAARFAPGGLANSTSVRDDLRTVDQTARADAEIAARDAEARAILGSLWKREQTDWPTIWAFWSRVKALRHARLQVPHALAEAASQMVSSRREHLVPGAQLAGQLVAVVDAEATLATAWQSMCATIERAPEAPEAGTIHELTAWLADARASGASALRNWTAWQRTRAALQAEGLSPIIHALEAGTISAAILPDVLRRARAQHAWAKACAEHPHLQSFQGLTHDRLIERFRSVDRDWEGLTAALVKARVAARMPNPDAPGEMATIRRQLNLKTRHAPLRKLFREVPTALRALKPVVLMSPLAVARYLDPASTPYDLVLFDEASQIPPWDAIGAIARGRRAIVVGDTRQLPPTSFFSRGDSEDDLEDEAKLKDMESILEESISSGLQELRLRWHYRSQHETLITFSNRSYYNNGLLTFPSAKHTADDLGVALVPVPHGYYDRGSSRTNKAEAEAVVAWIQSWASRPQHLRGSVGVVTFNINQQRLIEDLLDSAAASNPALESARNAGDEPLFVKNLENVQGDERDNILFSICYAPDRNGRLSQNYGPLNKRGGERRLNVAITRARRHLRVFSTLRHDQIQLSQTRSVGVQHLRTFLDFARRGVQALDEATHLAARSRTESPFEDEVLRALQDDGWTVEPQVGCSGYRIDLGVVDPKRPGTYLLAVECDGAAYHSSTSARARDRQRQEVLEHLGWRFHRIWSTDWWHDRQGEREKLAAALRAAQEAAEQAATAPADPPPQARAAAPPPTPAPARATPKPKARARPARKTFQMPPLQSGGTRAQLTRTGHGDRWLTELVQAIAPVHVDPAYRWLLQCADATGGTVRLTKAARADCDQLAARLVRLGRLERRGDVLWRPDQRNTWTDWRLVGDRKAEQIPPEEVRNAAADMLRAALAVPQDEFIQALARSMGFARVGKRVQTQMSAGISLLIAEGLARVEGSKLIWSAR